MVPILVDGMTTILGLFGVIFNHIARRRQKEKLSFYPYVTLILPIYNSESTLEDCLRSIEAQSYPEDKMEVILVDNGSTDGSYDVFARLSNELNASIYWHAVQAQGKSWALNAGIHLAKGQYIFNIDSDVFLAERTVENTITYMEANPDVGAVTGNLVIMPSAAMADPWRRLLTTCEFLEYLTAFGVGRSYQTFFRAVYTLSGAYSVFRREAISSTFLYNKETVSEDTDLTFQLYDRVPKYRVANLTDAKIYLEPIESLAALYSQRVRWQRGQLEVSARYKRLLKRPFWRLFGLAPTRALIIDHTLAFPRLVWLVFFPVLLLYGYSLSLLLTAYFIVYLFYLGVEAAWFGAAYLFADHDIRKRVLSNWFYIPLMPVYRITIFFFRFSGFLHVITEPRTWRVTDPITQLRAAWDDVQMRWETLWKTFRERLAKSNP